VPDTPISMRGELVRVGYQWSVVSEFFQGTLSGEGDSLLTHFLLPIYPFIFRERCRWTVSVFRSILYQRGIITYPFPTSHLPIYFPWTVSNASKRDFGSK